MGMKMWAAGAAVLTSALLPTAADAGFYTGDALYESCTADKDSKDYFERSYECVGYISGAVDAFNTTREGLGLKSCIPSGVTLSDLKKATVTYLGNNPVDRAQSASSQVFAATRKAWPCKDTKKSTRKNPKKKR